MTSTSLAQRRNYLDGQRRTIIARSVLAGIAGAVPLPFLDTWVVSTILGGGYRRIAASHQVDLSPEAVTNLVHGTSAPPSLVDMATAGIIVRVASGAAKRVMVALTAVRRARSAAHTFVVMTLFDHYCAKLHRGLALDGPTALILRDEITRAIDQTPGALGFHPFRRGVLSAARATMRAPLELADLASGGALRRLLARKNDVTEPERVDDLEHAMESELANDGGFLARAVASIEGQLASESNPFLDGALEALDRRWRARVAADPSLVK